MRKVDMSVRSEGMAHERNHEQSACLTEMDTYLQLAHVRQRCRHASTALSHPPATCGLLSGNEPEASILHARGCLDADVGAQNPSTLRTSQASAVLMERQRAKKRSHRISTVAPTESVKFSPLVPTSPVFGLAGSLTSCIG